MLKEANDPTRQANQRARTDADGPPLLAVDNRLVIPAGKVVKFIITADDVIHSFAMPAFWIKQDANPGQLHETWAKVDRPGVYFGQCSELCGARHGFMPIAIEVVPPAQFAAWVASEGRPHARRQAGRLPAGAATITPAAAARRSRHAGAAANPTARDQPGRDRAELRAKRVLNEHHRRLTPPAGRTKRTTRITMRTTSRASSSAGSCRRTTRTSARST